MKLKSVIIDDESMARYLLRSLIDECCPEVTVAGEAECVDEAIPIIEKERPQILFLDINMPETNGFELLRRLYDSRKYYTVFVSGHKDHALQALKEGASDFLLKPLDPVELRNGVRRIYEDHAAELTNFHGLYPTELDKQITIRHTRGFRLMRLRDIIHIDASDNYTSIHLADGSKLIAARTLKDMETRLAYSWFLRTHKSHLINLYHLVEYLTEDGGMTLMSNGTRLPVARFRMNEIMEYINRCSNDL